jgi:hypothetical protein
MRHIMPISGKDSLATWLVQRARAPELPYEPMFNPTGAETPEVDAWLARVEAYTGVPIHRVGNSLEDIIDEIGMLPSVQARFCTRKSKIEPMEDWIGRDTAIIYYGIRADEKRTGYVNARRPNLVPCYPLVEEGVGLDGVWTLCQGAGLLPPAFFWESLYDSVVLFLGDYAPVLDTLSPIMHQRLFAGRSRMNCSFCFFQRAYEWVWLSEVHPPLFWRAVEMEETTGATDYTWRYKQPLRSLLERADSIKRRRALQIVRYLLPQQQDMFADDEGDVPDLLQVVSCGLFCGK